MLFFVFCFFVREKEIHYFQVISLSRIKSKNHVNGTLVEICKKVMILAEVALTEVIRVCLSVVHVVIVK